MVRIHSYREGFFRKGASISEIAREHGMKRKASKKLIEREDSNRNTE